MTAELIEFTFPLHCKDCKARETIDGKCMFCGCDTLVMSPLDERIYLSLKKRSMAHDHNT